MQSSESLLIENAIMEYFPEAYSLGGGTVCGGFIRSTLEKTDPNDMDIFFQDQASFQKADEYISRNPSYTRTESAYTVTFTKPKRKIQLVKNIYGSYKELTFKFDFTVCMVTMPLIQGMNVFMSGWFQCDLASKRLRILNITDAMGTLRRVARYMEYGYSAEPCDILFILNTLALQYPKSDDYPEETLLPATSTALNPDEYDPFTM